MLFWSNGSNVMRMWWCANVAVTVGKPEVNQTSIIHGLYSRNEKPLEPNKTHGKMKALSHPKMWIISYNPLNMRENVGFWRFLMVSRSKSSWSPPTFQRFSSEFSQQSTKSRKFSSKLLLSEKTKPQLDQCEISWKKLRENHFRLNFQLRLQEKKKSSFSKEDFLDGVSTCSEIMKKNAAMLPRLQSFCSSNILTYRSCQLTYIEHPHVIWDFPQFCSFTMAELRWKWVWYVKIVWMIKKAYLRWKWWLVTTRTLRHFFHGENLKKMDGFQGSIIHFLFSKALSFRWKNFWGSFFNFSGEALEAASLKNFETNGWNLEMLPSYQSIYIPFSFEPTVWSNYNDLTRPHPKRYLRKRSPLFSEKSRLELCSY